jgi:hypothetical protein
MAYAMVLHGETVSQEVESTPEEGFTMTETSAALTPWRHNAHSRMALMTDARKFEQIIDECSEALNFMSAG